MRTLSSFTEEEKTNIAIEYSKRILKCPQIGKIYNTGAWTIEKILKEKGIEKIACKLSKAQKEEFIKDYYNGNKKLADYAKIYGTTPENLSYLLKRRGLKVRSDAKNRIFDFNQNYFNRIDTEGKAYFLGLLYADGCNRTKENKVSIALQKRDKDILIKFQKEISHNGELKVRELNKKNPNHQDSYHLLLCSSILSKDLNKLGCVAAKSLILKFPSLEYIPDNLLKHFIRGYIDGDGSIGLYKLRSSGKEFVSVKITSSKMFLKTLMEIIKDKLFIKCSMTRKYFNNGITEDLHIHGIKNVIPLLKWLYKDSNFYIQRKYDKAMEIINKYPHQNDADK